MYYDGQTPGKILNRRNGNLAADDGIIRQNYFLAPKGLSINNPSCRFHGGEVTHFDALCHAWDAVNGTESLFDGAPAIDVVDQSGCLVGDNVPFKHGIITRAVLIDIPRYRQSLDPSAPDYVPLDKPVYPWELEEALEFQCTKLNPGDAVLVIYFPIFPQT
jgi:hypothetical protein